MGLRTDHEAAEQERANAEARTIELQRRARKLEERRQNGRMWLETYQSRWRFYTKQASRALDQYQQLKSQLEKEK